MKKLITIIITLLLTFACSTANISKNTHRAFHSKNGYPHSHLTITEKENKDLIVILKFISKNETKHILRSNNNDKEYSNDKVKLTFLDNGEISLEISGQRVVFYELNGEEKENFGHSSENHGHAGHSH